MHPFPTCPEANRRNTPESQKVWLPKHKATVACHDATAQCISVQHFSVSPSARLYYVTMHVVPCNLQIKMLCKRRITAFGCYLNSKGSKTYCGTAMRLTPENPHARCHSLYACEWSMVIREVLKLSILLSHFRPQESQNICTTSDKVSTAQSYERTQNSADPGQKRRGAHTTRIQKMSSTTTTMSACDDDAEADADDGTTMPAAAADDRRRMTDDRQQ